MIPVPRVSLDRISIQSQISLMANLAALTHLFERTYPEVGVDYGNNVGAQALGVIWSMNQDFLRELREELASVQKRVAKEEVLKLQKEHADYCLFMPETYIDDLEHVVGAVDYALKNQITAYNLQSHIDKLCRLGIR
ncbi:MAG: hypothetical protein OIF48_17170 [Silicimonas sp.]|nr:hypothetical protein [Silicimonas sp.]